MCLHPRGGADRRRRAPFTEGARTPVRRGQAGPGQKGGSAGMGGAEAFRICRKAGGIRA